MLSECREPRHCAKVHTHLGRMCACASKVAPVVGTEVGMRAPSFTLEDADGAPVSLTDFADSPTDRPTVDKVLDEVRGVAR